jgi:nitroreductase
MASIGCVYYKKEELLVKETLKDLMTRRSCRKYKPEQIKEEELTAILEAGTYAPTGMGAQSPIIVAVQDKETRDLLSKLNAEVMGRDIDPFYGAPTVVVVLADKSRSTYVADGNMVMANLLNAAHAIGVDSCYIFRARQVFESEQGQALLKKWGIEGDYEGIGNCILGYGLPEGKGEAAPRKEGYIIRV